MPSGIDADLKKIRPVAGGNLSRAQEHLDSLTKPAGSLGRLEELGRRYAAIKGLDSPRVRGMTVYVFAGDHGVAAQGVSAYPAAVTPQMVLNFMKGGAAINVLARHFGAEVVVVDMGVNHDFGDLPGLVHRKIGGGTADISQGPAMSRRQAERALETGINLAREAAESGIDILGTGDMGIGNTTASTALISALSGAPVREITGRGTGVDDTALERKIRVIESALRINSPDAADPLGVLAALGGYEIAGIAGLILGAAIERTPVVIDGVISGAAALVAHRLNPGVADYLFTSHQSREPAHQRVFELLHQKPLFDFEMRLGEGTGAVIGMSLLEAGAKIYSEMATFQNGGVSNRKESGC